MTSPSQGEDRQFKTAFLLRKIKGAVESLAGPIIISIRLKPSTFNKQKHLN